MKKLISICTILVLITTMPLGVNATSNKEIKIVIDTVTHKFDASPIKVNGSVMVPMRGVFENLDATVNWNSEKQEITAWKDNRKIVLTIGSNEATIDDETVSMVVASQIIKGSTMVPIRFVAESLNAEVKWIDTENTVDIRKSRETLNLDDGKNNPTIESFIESYTKEQLKKLNDYKITDGSDFSENINSKNRSERENNNASQIRFNFTKDNISYQVDTTFSKTNKGHQSHNFEIDKGNGNIVYGQGIRKQLGELYVFETDITDIETNNNYIGNSIQQELIILDSSIKKVYCVLTTIYRVNDDNDFSEPVKIKVRTSIYNYQDDLEDNDYASLFVSNKAGQYQETNFNVDRTLYYNTYSKHLDGFNGLPIYIDIDVNRPYIYAYEVMAQLSKPNWDFHQKTPFFKHSASEQKSETATITNQQIEDMKYPFE